MKMGKILSLQCLSSVIIAIVSHTYSSAFAFACSQLEIYLTEGTHSTEEDSECEDKSVLSTSVLISRSVNNDRACGYKVMNSCVLFCLAVNKQINDKERVAAAMENPNLREMVEQCVTESDD